jgi:hypothetical protein
MLCAAGLWAALLLLGSIAVPLESDQMPPISGELTSNSAVESSTSAFATINHSIYDNYGVRGVLLCALPLATAVLVTLLLYVHRAQHLRWALRTALAMSIAILGVAVLLFVTILIGIFVVPVGVLLLGACVTERTA